jgi:protein involved in polysaccharide export with SLBB domain
MSKERKLTMSISFGSENYAKSSCRRRLTDVCLSRRLWKLGALWLLSFLLSNNALADATLRPGDTMDLKIGGVPSTEISSVSGQYTIDGEGSVNLPYIGRVKIGGLAPGAAQTMIESVYKDRKIYTNPNIVITMQPQSRFVNVGGEVKLPQRVPFTPDLTVLSAINAAGGFSPFADERRIRLLRGQKVTIIDAKKIRSNPSRDVQLEPGDRVEVPQSLF